MRACMQAWMEDGMAAVALSSGLFFGLGVARLADQQAGRQAGRRMSPGARKEPDDVIRLRCDGSQENPLSTASQAQGRGFLRHSRMRMSHAIHAIVGWTANGP
jgi:hypothetical protein